MEAIEGYIDHVIFRNESNGYTVLSVEINGKSLTVTGSFPFVNNGAFVKFEGSFINHNTYGKQFEAKSYEEKQPEDEDAIKRYLESGAIKGIGKKIAEQIVKKFGKDTFSIIADDPYKLTEIKGINKRLAESFNAQFIEKQGMRDAMMFLQKYGIPASLSAKIYKQYGAKLKDVINNNPYKLAEDIDGVGFKTSDAIAMRVGIPANSEHRIEAGLIYAMTQNVLNGNVYMLKQQLFRDAAELLDAPGIDLVHAYNELMVKNKLIVKQVIAEPLHEADYVIDGPNDQVYLSMYYYMELNSARMLTDLNIEERVSESELESFFRYLDSSDVLNRNQASEGASRIVLDDLQKEAVAQAARNNVLILTGGPGTGKTTTINAIIKYFENKGMEILLAAPTGRAARRMKETTGKEARTIHRLLEINKKPEDNINNMSQRSLENMTDSSFTFQRNEENPLETDVIIIDEMSMVDINLMHSLLKAIPVGTKLILAGDVNQLPSVGAGAVLSDMINSGCFNTVCLKHIFRQAQESDIIMNAHKINAGMEISLDNKSKDFFMIKTENVKAIIGEIIILVRDQLPKYVHCMPYDVQVLTPMRKGELGVENLNNILQQYLNPPDPVKTEREAHGVIFRDGDKVMQIKNNYEIEWEIRNERGFLKETGVGVFNGDCGIIKKINDFAELVDVEFDDGRVVSYPYNKLDEIELAYAITIHKSQGSEYPAVVIPILSGPTILFSRNILYTAVTRARKCVTIAGSADRVRKMIQNVYEQKRYTGLKDRIMEFAGKVHL